MKSIFVIVRLWRLGLCCLTALSVISWRSVLVVEETGGPGENHRPVIGTDCPSSCKSNYNTIRTTTAPDTFEKKTPKVLGNHIIIT
jgi:hypothetical protein